MRGACKKELQMFKKVGAKKRERLNKWLKNPQRAPIRQECRDVSAWTEQLCQHFSENGVTTATDFTAGFVFETDLMYVNINRIHCFNDRTASITSYQPRVSQQLLRAFSFLTYKHLRAESCKRISGRLHAERTPGTNRGNGSGQIKIL